ncbi:MAG: glutamyl-tRNA reductase [Deltaproteobacteria bacterium]|nr:glutamyl-tRNA reductase [Deltaproteobacteria bacterium]
MSIVVVGMSHKTAPLSIREKICFSSGSFGQDLKPFEELRKVQGVEEGLILSTCNRVEICAAIKDSGKDHGQDRARAIQNLSNFLKNYHECPHLDFSSYLYCHEGKEAIHHTFRVASSLDSLVVGEPQILGQVKEAYRASQQARALGPMLHRFFNRAFFVAKRVRTETEIGSQSISVGSVAVQLCQKIFKELMNKNILLIGAGEMVEVILEHLIQKKIQSFYIANRSQESVLQLQKRFKHHNILVHTVPFHELGQWLFKMDVVLASTRCPQFILTQSMMEKAIQQRRQHPIFFIDISVPRNIDPSIHNVDNVYLYNIDDLQSIVKENMKYREQEALKAEQIVQEEVDKFYEKMRHRNTWQSACA